MYLILINSFFYTNIFKLIILFILLFKASRSGHHKVVSLLINHPSFNSINEKEGYSLTALHYGEYLNIFISIVLLFYYSKHQCMGLIKWLVC